jgi:hypothetical protein
MEFSASGESAAICICRQLTAHIKSPCPNYLLHSKHFSNRKASDVVGEAGGQSRKNNLKRGLINYGYKYGCRTGITDGR